MKLRCGFILCMVALGLARAALAGDADVDITALPRKFEDKPAAGYHADEVSKTQQWGYSVTLENKTFKPIDNLEVQYIIFYKHEQLGIKGPPQKKHISGKYTIKELASLAKSSFDTDSVQLTKASLIGEVGSYSYFANGAKPKAADSLTGLWVRVYQNGNLYTEFAVPSDLPSREQWE